MTKPAPVLDSEHLLAAHGEAITTADEVLAGLSGYQPASRVVTGVVTGAGADVAIVTLRDGRTGRLPVTEFYPNRRWEQGRMYTFAECDSTARPLLSTTRPELVPLLLAGVVPELRDGRVRIMRTVRQVGIRTKVSVAPTDADVDAVGALIGRAACRLKTVSAMLDGERVDVVPFHPDKARFVVNALAVKPLHVEVLESGAVSVTVPPHQLQSALGGGGLNVSLAARLTGCRIVIQSA